VNKFAYGVRLPVLNRKVVQLGNPKRGDVMVFRYPEDPSLDYIKRVVGLPGDRIEYRGKRLTINGQPVPTRQTTTTCRRSACSSRAASSRRSTARRTRS